ncbi:MAG: diacylglycerol kinase family protein [Prolixibacteraceae bacterium]|jgi:diacylglycerol kinase (ATP)|nr:diacylglycerol kinase family protein [Prolixibacteraceae bacterium]
MSKNIFKPAIDGIIFLFRSQRNAVIHLLVTFLVIVAGVYFDITKVEWIAILLCIGLVLVSEGMNTAIEQLGDAITKDNNQSIKKAKDVAAGAVLMAAIIAAVAGFVIFTPYLIKIFFS